MSNLSGKIDPKLIAAEDFNLEDLEEEMSNNLDGSGILQEGSFYKGSSKGIFSDDLWIVENELTQEFKYFKFYELDKFKFLGLKENTKILIKCWIAYMLMEGYNASGLLTKYNHLIRVIELTNNFDESHIEAEKRLNLRSMLESLDYNIDSIVKGTVSYVDYVIQVNVGTNNKILQKYSYFFKLLIKGTSGSNVRNLPRNIDIIRFDYYVKRFFEEEQNVFLRLYFMPILLWWKITNIIPMRPSELCFKIKRNCLKIKDNKYYLKISRVKQSNIKHKHKQKARLPILDKVEITKKIYDLVDAYIKETDSYGKSETLISYRAYDGCRAEINKIGSYECFKNPVYNKYNLDAFSCEILNTLIKNFYSVIIEKRYKDKDIIDKVKMGDTRHFAFTSLMIQGIDPVQIAMIGGHTTLHAQGSYESNVSFYVDSEMVNLVNLNQIVNIKPLKTLKDIVFNQVQNCPKNVNECLETEEGIGYCMCDFENEEVTCEDENYCFYCSKWWCEPIEDNYIKLVRLVKESVIPLKEKQVREEELFLNKIMANFKTENINGVLAINKDYKEEYERKRLLLKSNVDNLIEIKASIYNSLNKLSVKGDTNGET